MPWILEIAELHTKEQYFASEVLFYKLIVHEVVNINVNETKYSTQRMNLSFGIN